jgi:hypothetical protein
LRKKASERKKRSGYPCGALVARAVNQGSLDVYEEFEVSVFGRNR